MDGLRAQSFVQFVEDIITGEAHRDIDIFFQGHCSDHALAMSSRKFTIEYLEGLHLPSVQASCDKSVRSFPIALKAV